MEKLPPTQAVQKIMERLQIVGIGDASLKTYEKAVGGLILSLVNMDFIRASPIY